MKKRVLVPVIPAVAALAFAAPALAATTAAVSENWAGYEVTSNNGSGFSSVSGEWTQPAVKCTAGQATYSAYWVGLGGGGQSSNALEQQGTQANCNTNGQASYYAWYELVPSTPVKINMKVSPGDQIYSRTSVSGDQVTVEVDNKTTGQNFVKTLTMSNPSPDTTTAEWVAEAPSQCYSSTLSNCSVLPLSDFGSVKFTNAQATSAGHTGTISDSQWTATPVTLSSSASSLLGGGYGGYYPSGYSTSGYGGGYGGYYPSASGYGYQYGYTPLYNAPYGVSGSGSGSAAPGPLSSDGSSFTVTYGASAGTSTSSSSATGGSSSTSGSGSGSASTGTGYPYSSSDPYGYYPGGGYSSVWIYGNGGYAVVTPGGWYYSY